MNTKCCSICSIEKLLTAFYTRAASKDSRTSQCKSCERVRKLHYYNSNRQEASIRARDYKLNNREHLNEYQKKKIRKDLNYRLSKNLRNRLNQILRKNKTDRVGSAVKDLGCIVSEFKIYIEELFRDGMSWENYGTTWHLDHIIPLCNFDLTNREHFIKACHYTNLQPLWKEDNWSKGGRK